MSYGRRKNVVALRSTEFIPSRCVFRANGMNSVLRTGMTLVELLVVMVIILIVAAATIPRLRPEIDRNRVREAARSIQLYLSSARTQAMVTGRSCGVMIERLSAEPGCSMQLTQVETPPTYGGDFSNSTGTVTSSSNPSTSAGYANCVITLGSAPSVPLYTGDLIQFGYQGYWITLSQAKIRQGWVRNDNFNSGNSSSGTWPSAINTGAQLKGEMDISHGETPPWNAGQSITGPYSIIRWPSKSAASPLQLPSPACIDLTLSGPSTLRARRNQS